MVEPAVEEADEEVVHHGEEPGGANGIVGADVGHDGDFRSEWHGGAYEGAEELCEGAVAEPVAEGVKDEFVTAVCVSVIY